MSEFKILSGIPIPPRPVRADRRKYPFDAMKQGESIFIPKVKLKQVRGPLYSAAHRQGVKISARQFNQDGVEGVMVWRASE